MLVKICGITRAEDAELAVECGAHALGFIFWPESPRFVDPDRARTIVAALPPFVSTVGVFVNQPADEVIQVARTVRLGAVQLHGDEAPGYAAAIGWPVIKAVAASDAIDVVLHEWPHRTMLLVDVHDPVRRGGTGRTVNWSRAASLARRRRIVLAGGLTPENVAEAIALVQPFGIDVSSGVEAAPGRKDPGRLRALFDAVRHAEVPQR